MTAFKVMTWNVENLFRPGNPAGPKTKGEYLTKLTSLAHLIGDLDLDVLALQEVSQEAAFEDLVALLNGRYSRVFRDQRELIDHIFASQEFFPGQPRRLPDVDSHVNFADVAESITENVSERRGKPGSDHAPVTAVFDL